MFRPIVEKLLNIEQKFHLNQNKKIIRKFGCVLTFDDDDDDDDVKDLIWRMM
jgi:hypothetical protein